MAPILPDLDPGTIYLVDHDGTAWRVTPVTLAASVDFVRLGGRCAVECDRDNDWGQP